MARQGWRRSLYAFKDRLATLLPAAAAREAMRSPRLEYKLRKRRRPVLISLVSDSSDDSAADSSSEQSEVLCEASPSSSAASAESTKKKVRCHDDEVTSPPASRLRESFVLLEDLHAGSRNAHTTQSSRATAAAVAARGTFSSESDSSDVASRMRAKQRNSLKVGQRKNDCEGSQPVISNTDRGRLVWAKDNRYNWPGIIVLHTDCCMEELTEKKVWVLWFGDYRVSIVNLEDVFDFENMFNDFFKEDPLSPLYMLAVQECLQESYRLAGKEEPDSMDEMLLWAKSGFKGCVEGSSFIRESEFSPMVTQRLKPFQKGKLRQLLCKQLTRGPFNSEIMHTMESLRKGEKDIEEVCIACDFSTKTNITKHPHFVGGLCESCQEEYACSYIEEDGKMLFCCICASFGRVVICSRNTCGKAYCENCIQLMISESVFRDIKNTTPWYCFTCKLYSERTHGLINARIYDLEASTEVNTSCGDDTETEQMINGNYQASDDDDEEEEEYELLPDISKFTHRPIRVLSLFDGIATGLYVLIKLGIKVDKYFASEVDEAAMNVAKMNFDDKIEYVGCVESLTEAKVAALCPIDLLIGGSPCNDLSLVNPNRKGLTDPTGTGILFFYYYKVLNLIKLANRGNHLFWLYENVKHMSSEHQKHMQAFFEMKPVIIDAANFSPQQRKRHFWGNIPGMRRRVPPEVTKMASRLDECVLKVRGRQAVVSKIKCITTNSNSLRGGMNYNFPIQVFGRGTVPLITEIEKIFGFPPHYTDFGDLNISIRQGLLGRSWSVPVIEYLLKSLKSYFKCEDISYRKVGFSVFDWRNNSEQEGSPRSKEEEEEEEEEDKDLPFKCTGKVILKECSVNVNS